MKTYTENLTERDQGDVDMINRLLGLPHKILTNHEIDGLAHLVLHDLAHENVFGLNRAGYLIDNPDFNCLRGVAGYCSNECQHHKTDVWQDPRAFMQDMQNAEFHRKLSTYLDHSIVRQEHGGEVDEEAIKHIGESLGLKSPTFLRWKMKHGNNGILIFEGQGPRQARHQDLLRDLLPLLGLC